MNKEKVQIAQELALTNIIKYVCKVAGLEFLAKDDKVINEELSILTGEVENVINEK